MFPMVGRGRVMDCEGMSEPQAIVDLDRQTKYGFAEIKKCCLLYCFLPISVIVAIILLIIGINIPPKPSVSLLSLTTATDTVATSATTPTGGSFTAQNLTAVFSISSRNKAAVIYSSLRCTGSQYGTPDYHGDRPFISTATATASVPSMVQSGPSIDTVEFRQPNATVVIESWMGVRIGFSALLMELHLRAKYVGKTRSVPMWVWCERDLMAEILVNGQDSPPQLYFIGQPLDCNVSSPWDTVLIWSSVWFGILVGLGIDMIRQHYKR